MKNPVPSQARQKVNPMTFNTALVIGAGGGIGAQILAQLAHHQGNTQVHAVSRQSLTSKHPNVTHHQMLNHDEPGVSNLCEALKQVGQFDLVVCCIGALHGEQNKVSLTPEKRLEDISAQQLESYFKINTIIPALWLKHLVPLVKGSNKAQVVMITARVASISDNRLGGWYGYRVSKAGLNMMIKTAQIEYQRRAKNVELISYHPGTVDTNLSKPFQGNVPNGKLFTADFTASQLLKHLETLDINKAPHYIDWNNQPIPW